MFFLAFDWLEANHMTDIHASDWLSILNHEHPHSHCRPPTQYASQVSR